MSRTRISRTLEGENKLSGFVSVHSQPCCIVVSEYPESSIVQNNDSHNVYLTSLLTFMVHQMLNFLQGLKQKENHEI